VRDALCVYRLRESLRQSHAQLAPLARRAGWLIEEAILQNAATS
jgi:hypothetical protein